jgi:hypothetical protein
MPKRNVKNNLQNLISPGWSWGQQNNSHLCTAPFSNSIIIVIIDYFYTDIAYATPNNNFAVPIIIATADNTSTPAFQPTTTVRLCPAQIVQLFGSCVQCLSLLIGTPLRTGFVAIIASGLSIGCCCSISRNVIIKNERRTTAKPR